MEVEAEAEVPLLKMKNGVEVRQLLLTVVLVEVVLDYLLEHIPTEFLVQLQKLVVLVLVEVVHVLKEVVLLVVLVVMVEI